MLSAGSKSATAGMATDTGVLTTRKRMNVALEEVQRMREHGALKEMPPPSIVEGIALPHGISLETFQELRRSFVANPSDVFVVTYPKCGTTWVQQIVTLIKNNGVDDGVDLDDRWLWIELFTAEEVEHFSTGNSRMFKCHLPYSLMLGKEPAKSPAKYIYVYRNPKDTAVSLYHHAQSIFLGPTPWDGFIESHMSGKQFYGDILDHHIGWWKHKDAPSILILSYEEMKADLHGSVEKIAAFLGNNLDKETVESITKQCTFSAMQKNDTANKSWLDKFRKETDPRFMRKGIVGDWRNQFTEEQSKKMDMLVAKKVTGTGLEYDYGQ